MNTDSPRQANSNARRAALGLVLCLLSVLALFAALKAFGQVPEPSPTPVVTPMNDPTALPAIRWLDRTLLPFLHYLGEHPVLMAIAGAMVLYVFYMVIANAVVWAFRVRYDNDRKKCSFKALVIWNLLEATGGSPWILLGRTARHYWPIAFKPWEDMAEGKTPPGSPG